jgi:hypothetical protein
MQPVRCQRRWTFRRLVLAAGRNQLSRFCVLMNPILPGAGIRLGNLAGEMILFLVPDRHPP